MTKKRIIAVVLVLVFSLAFAGIALAEGETTPSTVDTMTTAFSGIQSDVMSAVGTIAPIAIAIFGVFLIWRLGKKFFKTVAN